MPVTLSVHTSPRAETSRAASGAPPLVQVMDHPSDLTFVSTGSLADGIRLGGGRRGDGRGGGGRLGLGLGVAGGLKVFVS